MKFTIDKSILFKAVNKVQKATDQRSSLPFLRGILIEAERDYLKLTATDLSLTIQCIIQGVDIQEIGRVLISAKFFNDLLKKLSGEIAIETNGDKLKLTCGELSANLNVLDSEDFPAIPAILNPKELRLPTKALKTALNKTIHCTSSDDIRPVFSGVLFKAKENLINFVATDTHRMAVLSRHIEESVEVNAIVPSKATKAMSSIFDDEVVRMQFGEEFAVFSCSEIKVITKLIEGQFPNYKAVIPSDPIAKFSVDKMILRNAIDRASIFCEKHYRIVKMAGGESLSVSGSSSLFGEVKETIKVEHEGEAVKIAFNSEFLLQAINATSEERLVFKYSGSNGPMTICEDGYTQLILPVRTE
ncbi:DNA polymerase III subunit beta [Desulfosporosinus nitroreducens]|uniref:DNA polymerase III subunit beta n=1 Tax=Desulfosporosinus nitroreducens TaxID=2018668 RepID=UPI00207CDEE2|nr:DNA polymerase III subunit beta [Desulfosporosinus nitroreducens]MCO1599851.1 DNA polymerase III subunit beta [Desulfosporosinus nitroreducens]